MTGSFAVICLMVANVCEREVAKMSFDEPSTQAPGNMSSTLSPTTSSSRWSPVDTVKLEIAVSLACLIGIFQVRVVPWVPVQQAPRLKTDQMSFHSIIMPQSSPKMRANAFF